MTKEELAATLVSLSMPESLIMRKLVYDINDTMKFNKEQSNTLVECIKKVIPEYHAGMAETYALIFDEKELEQLIEFRRSPVGEKELKTRDFVSVRSGELLKRVIHAEMLDKGLLKVV